MKLKLTKQPRKAPPRVHTMPDGTEYPFSPEGDRGPFVCEVENEAHVKRFLARPGFAPVDPAEAADIEDDEEPVDPIDDPDAVAAALGDDEEEDDDGDEDVDAAGLMGMTKDELADEYELRFGERPHHRTGKKKLIELLAQSEGEE